MNVYKLELVYDKFAHFEITDYDEINRIFNSLMNPPSQWDPLVRHITIINNYSEGRKPDLPWPDFFHSGLLYFMNKRSIDLLKEVFNTDSDVRSFPVNDLDYYVINNVFIETNPLEVLNVDEVMVEYYDDHRNLVFEKLDPHSSDAKFLNIKIYSFIESAINDFYLFRYVPHFFATDKFVELVNRYQLSGFRFRLIWSSEITVSMIRCEIEDHEDNLRRHYEYVELLKEQGANLYDYGIGDG